MLMILSSRIPLKKEDVCQNSFNLSVGCRSDLKVYGIMLGTEHVYWDLHTNRVESEWLYP
jgi:hypothetical protein